MNQLEILIDKAYQEGITIVEKDLKSKAKGLCKGNKIAINKSVITIKEKACILAEELGHYYTTVGNIINPQDVKNRKQELKAKFWAYNEQIGLMGIIKAYEAKCYNLFEMAEYLDVTEEFLLETINCYKSKYGVFTEIDNYIIYFEPNLVVMKRM